LIKGKHAVVVVDVGDEQGELLHAKDDEETSGNFFGLLGFRFGQWVSSVVWIESPDLI